MTAAKVICRTPTPGRKSTRIDPWKFVRVRNIILAVLSEHPAGVQFSQLPDLVTAHMSDDEAGQIGSINWYTTTVKLELEVRGEIRRLSGSGPQRLAMG